MCLTASNYLIYSYYILYDKLGQHVWCISHFIYLPENSIIVFLILLLQCFEAVGWAAARASGLLKTEWWGAGVVICLEQGTDLHMAQLMPLPLTVSCFSKIQIGFTFLVPAHLGSPGKRAVKRVCVCEYFLYWSYIVYCVYQSSHWLLYKIKPFLKNTQQCTTFPENLSFTILSNKLLTLKFSHNWRTSRNHEKS